MKTMKEWREKLYQCPKEGSCLTTSHPDFLSTCPPINYYRFQSYYAGGLLYLARKASEDRIEYGQGLYDVVSSCTTCGMCTARCANDVPVAQIVTDFKAELVSRGFGPSEGQKAAIEAIEAVGNPFGRPAAARYSWLLEDLPHEGEALYFAGCKTAYEDTSVGKDIVRLLKHSGLRFGVLADKEICCGGPLWNAGLPEAAIDQARRVIARFKEAGAKTVVTSCPHCIYTLQQVGDGELSYVHVAEWLFKSIESGGLKPRHREGVMVTYHDSCYLGRHHNSFEEPREALRACGAELVEMPRNRELSYCCGAGGGVESAHPEVAKHASEARLVEAQATGANPLVTACPYCRAHLEAAGRRLGSSLAVVDVASFAAARL